MAHKQVWIRVVKRSFECGPGRVPQVNGEYFVLMAAVKPGRNARDDKDYNFYITPANARVVINGKVIRAETVRIRPTDKVLVSDILFSLRNGIEQEAPEHIIHVNELEISYPDTGVMAVHKLSFRVARGEFVALMGPSGCGKTTLLKELAGANNKVGGSIHIGNRNFEEDFHSEIKTKIGYVQQKDEESLHPSLTIEETLYYTAKLRRTPNYKVQIERLLTILKIKKGDRKKKVSSLSGGEKKRVAIAVELLDKPDILLLDEPTSPLDPETIDTFLTSIRELASEYNKAIIMVTHKPGDMKYVDRVIFLAKGGYQVYSGARESFLEKMTQQIREEGKELDNADKLLGIYAYYSNKDNLKRFRPGKPVYSKQKKTTPHREAFSFPVQLYWLVKRYTRSKFSTFSGEGELLKTDSWIKSAFNYILQPLIIGLLFFSFPNFTITPLFLLSLAVIWLGVSNASKEIVEELGIYVRERAFNLKIDAYLLSKILLLTFVAVFQILILLVMVWLRFKFHNTGKFPEIHLYDAWGTFVWLLALSVTSTMLGLLVSTFSNKVNTVLMWVPVILMPQVIFSGLVSKPDTTLKEAVSYGMVGRWGLEGLSRIQDSAAAHWDKELPGGYWVDSSNSVVVEAIKPQPFGGLRYSTNNAIYTLATYNNTIRKDQTKAWTTFDSLRQNYLVLLIHFLFMYLLCRLVLMKNDAIPVHGLVRKKMLSRYIMAMLLILGVLLFVSVLAKPKSPEEEPVPLPAAAQGSQPEDSGAVIPKKFEQRLKRKKPAKPARGQ